MIPKILHQTYKSETLPLREQSSSTTTRSFYADYEYVLWTDGKIEEFIRLHFPSRFDFFSKLTTIQKVDYVRYCWMYVFGGLYCDLDIVFVKRIPFDNYSGAVFIEREWTHPKTESISTSVHNAILASAPAHPCWIEIIDQIEAKHGAGVRNVFNLTGPNSISETITRLKLTQKYGDILILPGSYIHQYGFSKCSVHNAFVKHLCYGSWK